MVPLMVWIQNARRVLLRFPESWRFEVWRRCGFALGWTTGLGARQVRRDCFDSDPYSKVSRVLGNETLQPADARAARFMQIEVSQSRRALTPPGLVSAWIL